VPQVCYLQEWPYGNSV